MKLAYKGVKPLRMIYPVDETFENGEEIQTNDKTLIKHLKELGFEEVKEEVSE